MPFEVIIKLIPLKTLCDVAKHDLAMATHFGASKALCTTMDWYNNSTTIGTEPGKNSLSAGGGCDENDMGATSV